LEGRGRKLPIFQFLISNLILPKMTPRDRDDSIMLSLAPHHPLLYLASANPGKLREFREAAHDCGITVEVVPAIANLPACVEDGATFEANARKKALHYSVQCEGLVFADDSGLCVEALGGAPGAHSARFAGLQADDAANNGRLIAELRRFPFPERTAHYVCVIALAAGARLLTVTEGRVAGIILEAPRGSGGFGYDPLFLYPPLGRSFAELTLRQKFNVSHRGAAFRSLVGYLRNADLIHTAD
jgi:XTP/dITP diphosphohydrolase